MKISKSKQELARIISENGGWPSPSLAMFAVQNGCHGRISFSANKPARSDAKSWTVHGGFQFKIEVCKPLKNWHQTILSRAEYFHLYPAPGADWWIEWKGGERPVGEGVLIDVKKLNGTTELAVSNPEERIWDDPEHRYGIIAYRLHKPEQSKPEFCESVTRAIPEPDEQVWTNPPTIEQLAADYRNTKDYAERKQQEADAAKGDADAKLKALELAGAALGLLVSPITAKQEPELVITDWRQLKVGDLVEITTTRDGVNIGEAATIIAIDENNENFTVTVTFPEDKYPLEYSYERPPTTWRFIRRP